MFCKYCGKEMPDHAEFCSSCGARLRPKDAEPQQNTNSNHAQRIAVQPQKPNFYTPTQAARQFGGNPAQTAAQRAKMQRILVGSIVAFLVVALAVGAFAWRAHQKHQQELNRLNAQLNAANETAEEQVQAQVEAAEQKAAAEEKQKAAEEKQKKAEEEAQKAKEDAAKAQVEREAAEKASQQAAAATQSRPSSSASSSTQSSGSSSSNRTDDEDDGEDGGDNSDDNNNIVAASSGYVWPTNVKYITNSDLKNMSQGTIATIRNEMYARHGYAFNTQSWTDYFNTKSWYTPEPGVSMFTIQARFNSYEKANLKTIMAYEESKGWR